MSHEPDAILEALGHLQGMDPQAAVDYLKALAEAHPNDPRPLLLLAGHYAQTQDYAQAEETYKATVRLAPGFAIAIFQLGLLQFTSGRPGEALASWTPLDQLPEQHYLRLFKIAFAHLAQDHFQEALAFLHEGIAQNQENPPLNRDMQMLIQRILDAGVNKETDSSSPEDNAAAGDAHFLLSAYKQQS